MTRLSFGLVLAALALVLTACGDDSPVFGDGTAGSDTTATTMTTTSGAAPTTAASTTSDGTAPPPDTTPPVTATTVPGATAADALAEFTGAVEDLDSAIAFAAALFNESWEATGVISPEAIEVIEALDTSHLRDLIPPGLAPEVETAVLAVFSDLDSRVAALHGAVRFESMPDDVMICLELGAISFRRFDADYARLRQVAADSPAPTASSDSVEAGILAARLAAIHGLNWGCDSCGGYEYDQPIPVDWEAKTIFGDVGFDANFDGSRWEILIYAC